MVSYFVKYYGDEPALIKLEASGKINQSSDTKAYIYVDGKWIESPEHIAKVLYGGEYDEVTAEEAKEIEGVIDAR